MKLFTIQDAFLPKQPFMVRLSDVYYKYVVNNYGISHFFCFYAEEGINLIETSVPDGCIDLIFHFDKTGTQIGADWYGTDLSPHSMKCYEGCDHFGVRFLPGYLPALADASLPDLIDVIIPYDSAGKCKTLIEQIAECPDFKSRIQTFLQIYLPYFERSQETVSLPNYLVAEVVRMHGNTKIDELADKTGYSVRYLDKVFAGQVGISPKRFCGMMRFQWMLNRFAEHMEQGNKIDYQDIISELGYYDQPHMIREFKYYSNRTPGNYFTEMEKMNYSKRLRIVE